MTEIFFEKALKRASARKLDDYLLHSGEIFGPLHGVPFL